MTKPKSIERMPGSLPISGLDQNGKLKIEAEDERRRRGPR